MSEFITAIGLVFVIEGLLYALAPGRLKSMMAMAEQLPEEMLRTGGLLSIGAGVAIVWVARSLLSGT